MKLLCLHFVTCRNPIFFVYQFSKILFGLAVEERTVDARGLG